MRWSAQLDLADAVRGERVLQRTQDVADDPDTAAAFDGSIDRVQIGDVFGFVGTAAFTLELWAYPDSLGAEVRALISKQSIVADVEQGYRLRSRDDGIAFFRWTPAGGDWVFAPPLDAAVWSHLVVTYDGATVIVYVDAVYQTALPPSRIQAHYLAGLGRWSADRCFQPECMFQGNDVSAIDTCAHPAHSRSTSNKESSMRRMLGPVVGAVALSVFGCSGDDTGSDVGNFSSDQATLLTFEFDAELTTTTPFNLERLAEDQLLYTIGHLNANKSVGRLDTMVVSDFVSTRQDDGTTVVKYHVVLPVAWGSKSNLPTSYDLTLPKRIDGEGLRSFTDKYSHTCVDSGAHDVDSGSMWYYYRPLRSGCSLAAADVVKLTAKVTKSDENTTGKYPEYNKVWEDGTLNVVAIFGKFEDGATTSSDAGISSYNRFVAEAKKALGSGVKSTPANVPDSPGVAMPDVELTATLSGGRNVKIVALLVDNVSSAGADFDERYEPLSGHADLIFYNGHAGLGQNVRALQQKGEFFSGVYQIFFMNGCDTFAYVDGSLAEARAVLNPDDPSGTKYMDMITNAMPSFFHSMPYASMAVIKGLLNRDDPMTYEEIFATIDKSEVVLVTGEEDNVYSPDTNPDELWEGMKEQGSVQPGASKAFQTGKLDAGEYVVTLAHDPEHPGGDADLYVRLGKAPTATAYDFRPYLDGSDEKVTFRLESPTEVFISVRGYEQASAESFFLLTAAQTATN